MNRARAYQMFFMIYALFLLLLIPGCQSNEVIYPVVSHPDDNPYSVEKVGLGKKLFFDKRLSIDNTVACATCHQPDRAFTDNLSLSTGVFGRKSMRNAPSLINVAYQPHFMFEAEIKTLEMQAVVPITDLNEMGFEKIGELVDKLSRIEEYKVLAQRAFNRNFDVWVLTRSLAAYQRTIVSWNSDFDDFYFKGKPLNDAAMRGYKIFSEDLYCVACHPAPYFTTFELASNGIIDSLDGGRYRITGKQKDYGLFKIPSLKNITKTFPYMHNGSINSIEDVLTYYSNGGNGSDNQSVLIKPFQLTSDQKKDLLSFFKSLETK